MKLVRNPPSLAWCILATSVLFSFGYWHWVRYILAPANRAVVLATGRPIGNNSDLYPRWLGARELLLRGRDPYSPELTREMQIGFYGRPLNPQDHPSDPAAKESFVYPLYVVFLLAPTVHMQFRMVDEIFRWLLLGSIALSVPLWMRALRFSASWPLVVSGMLLATSSSPAAQEFFQQNLSALVIFFLAAAAAATVARRLTLAGILLALSTMKPDTSGLMVLCCLFWAIAQWRERQRLVWAFSSTLTALVLGAEGLSPGWIGRFLAAIREYPTYGTDPTILDVLLPALLAKLAAISLVFLLILVCWRWSKAPADSDYFVWALAWAAAVTLVVLPKLAAYNALLLVPALLVLLARYSRTQEHRLFARAMIKATFACQLWQWIAATLLSIWSILPPAVPIRGIHAPDYAFLASWLITLLGLISSTFSLRSNRHDDILPIRGA